MNLDTFSQTYKPVIEDYLQNTWLGARFSDSRQILQDAIRYSLTAKAKRIRPLLTLAVFLLYQPIKPISSILPLAGAIEMIHTYSLIHDDLPAMDNDDFRRGVPTCHKQFGEDTAILAGDVLNTYVWELLALELPKFFPADRSLLVIQKLANSLGLEGMAGGQMLDLKADQANLKTFQEDYLNHIHRLKTGALLCASVELPAILLQVDEDSLAHLKKYGADIGLLFQIVDDILDVIGKPEELGKSAGKDSAQNKVTFMSLWGYEKSVQKATELAKSACNHLQSLQNVSDQYREVLVDLIEYILKRKQ